MFGPLWIQREGEAIQLSRASERIGRWGAPSQRLGSGKPLILLLYRAASDREAVRYVLHISCVIICHAKPVRGEMGGRPLEGAYPGDSTFLIKYTLREHK